MTREEFIGLVPDVQEPLRRFLLVLCEGDAASADDLAQEALVSAYVASGTFRGASSFRTWVFRIAYHCFIDRLRARKIRTEPLDTFSEETLPAPDLSDGGFRHEALYQALRQLPDKERAALLLFYMEDRPVKEIASILEIPAGSVRAYLTRGRRHIKAYLEKWKTR